MRTPSSVVLDTNVLVSATLGDGPPYRILRLAEQGKVDSVTSPSIIAELEDVLGREHLPFTDEQVEEFTGKVLSVSTVIVPEIDLEVVERDPDDDKIVECAVAGNVDYLVSGDSHLKDLGEVEGIPVVQPADFIEMMEN